MPCSIDCSAVICCYCPDFDASSHGVFTSGWPFISRKKDVSDFEWAVWAPFLCASAPWVCVHLVVAEIVRYTVKEVRCVKHCRTGTTSDLFVNVTNCDSCFSFLLLYCLYQSVSP
jgi:hypothetical protein